MRTGWIVGGCLIAVAAGLLLFGRGGDVASDEAASDRPRAGLERPRGGAALGAGDRGAGQGEGLDAIGVGARARQPGGAPGGGGAGARSGAGAAGERAAAGGGAGLDSLAGADGDAAGGGRVPAAAIAGAGQAAEREAPKAGSTGPVDDFNAVGPDGQPIPDVAYDGGLEKVFPTDSQEELTDAGPIAGNAGTVSFWIRPEWARGDQNDATLIQLGDSGMELVKNVNFLRFQYHDSDGVEHGLGAPLGQWPPGQWRHVAAAWENGQLTLYVDGKLVSQGRYDAPPEFQEETKVYVGSAYASGAPASRASITGLQVLNRDAGAGEIGALFQAGGPRKR